ncbi:MAG: cysteine desulfurase [Saprospiraceae bacterium]|nr:MAG: cysteine desulfurase [Saprospiraceae bacterium]
MITTKLPDIRTDFPLLCQTSGDLAPIAYLDNAATTQKPQVVIDAMHHFYLHNNANVHRGVYGLAVAATQAYEAVRDKVCRFLNAADRREIVFTKGTTESINLVAQSLGDEVLKPGDEVLITAMEHHSNLIPWQMLCKRIGARLRVIPMDDRGALKLENLSDLLNDRTRILAMVHISNSLGTINPVKKIIQKAREKGILVLVDGAQSVAHLPVDVQDLDCDFFVCSGHKLFGPTGVGVLYGKKSWLERMQPYQYGGEMIKTVSFERSEFADLPHKFEAGTPNIAGVVGLGAAIDYIETIGRPAICYYLANLAEYALHQLREIDGLTIVGNAPSRSCIFSFTMEGIHPHDVATILDQQGVAVRAGHHCTEPVMDFFGIPGTIRASFALYNIKDEVDRLVAGLREAQHIFS